jgi:hypothetical protein
MPEARSGERATRVPIPRPDPPAQREAVGADPDVVHDVKYLLNSARRIADPLRTKTQSILRALERSSVETQSRSIRESINEMYGRVTLLDSELGGLLSLQLGDLKREERRTVRQAAVEIAGAVEALMPDLLLVLPAAEVQAQVPTLRAELKRHLGINDPRYDVYSRALDEVAGADLTGEGKPATKDSPASI